MKHDYKTNSLHQWSIKELNDWARLLTKRANEHRTPGSEGQRQDLIDAENYRAELQRKLSLPYEISRKQSEDAD